MDKKINKPEYFFNREVSWLKFNQRVLEEAVDLERPILERLRFIAITANNLDEFFMIRVASLKHQIESGLLRMDDSGLSPKEQLIKVTMKARVLIKKQYKYLKTILETLQEDKLYIEKVADLNKKSIEWLREYFHNNIFPVLTPMAIDASHPFPMLSSKTFNLVIRLFKESKENTEEEKIAIVQVPGILSRLLAIPERDSKKVFVFIEDVIREFCEAIFFGYKVIEVVPFRITRDADMLIEEEEADDLLEEVTRSLKQRKRGEAVRLEVARDCSVQIMNFLREGMEVEDEDIYEIDGPIDTTCFMKFADVEGFETLRIQPFTPQLPVELQDCEDWFQAISERDILLSHPYMPFTPVIEFIRQAANDPNVLAIKQVLYRVSGHSPIVQALSQAAENGKQVTVLVELKARFDEENNILWAQRLEAAGCHVIYGLVGLKTHAKITLVVRREFDGIRRYVHLGTGNYNDSTAKIYTDIGLFTVNDQMGADASAFFNLISGYSDPPIWNKLAVAPLGLREKFYELIDREIICANNGQPAHIIAKINSLVDRGIVLKLYEASAAGVKIELIIRGICVLKPGVEGISDNITVRSIVGRFLEHSRVFYFANGGNKQIYMSSADWMPRNLDRRVELLFPIEDERHIEYIMAYLEFMLADNRKAYQLGNDGIYRRVRKKGTTAFICQMELAKLTQKMAKQKRVPLNQLLKPIYRKDGA